MDHLIENESLLVEYKPRVGMQFDSAEAAWRFWVDYGGKIGFGVRKDYLNKSRKDGSYTSCRFVCCKEGIRKPDKRNSSVINHRPETRTDCKARITLVAKNGKFIIREFVEDHNHPLQLAETIQMLISQRKILQVQADKIELGEDSRFNQRATLQLMSMQVGDRTNLDFTQLDAKNDLQSKRRTKETQNGIVHDVKEKEVEEDPKHSSTQRYRQLCNKMIRLATEVSSCKTLHLLVDRGIDDLYKRVMEIHMRPQSMTNYTNDTRVLTGEDATQPEIFRKHVDLMRQRCLKSWVELQSKNKRRTPTLEDSKDQQNGDNETLSQTQCGVSCSTPPTSYENQQTLGSKLSFNRLLVESLETPVQSLEGPNICGAFVDINHQEGS